MYPFILHSNGAYGLSFPTKNEDRTDDVILLKNNGSTLYITRYVMTSKYQCVGV